MYHVFNYECKLCLMTCFMLHFSHLTFPNIHSEPSVSVFSSLSHNLIYSFCRLCCWGITSSCVRSWIMSMRGDWAWHALCLNVTWIEHCCLTPSTEWYKTNTYRLHIHAYIHIFNAAFFLQHEEICRFPSEAYYLGRLKTKVDERTSVLHIETERMRHSKHILFGDIRDAEISLVVSTARGNENSKANFAEVEKAVSER